MVSTSDAMVISRERNRPKMDDIPDGCAAFRTGGAGGGGFALALRGSLGSGSPPPPTFTSAAGAAISNYCDNSQAAKVTWI